MRIIFFLYILLATETVFAELLKPSSNLQPQEVISIQLNALKDNNNPYEDAGIEQTWVFAHPSNKLFTGPLSNFIKMMYSPSYVIMLDHLEHNIIFVSYKPNVTYFFIELTDKEGNKFGFRWIMEKVIINSEFKDCWMTIGVSKPLSVNVNSYGTGQNWWCVIRIL